MSIDISGVITALVTPMNDDNTIDYNSFKKLIDWQIEKGIDGLVPAATTGESPTLTHDEHQKILEICIEQANKRVPIIAAAGSNSTNEAMSLSKHAEKNGADALLIITPYYNNPTQQGIIEHFKKISENVTIPIIVYNVPSRCLVDIQLDTMVKIAELENVIGVKDASGQIDRVSTYRNVISKEFIQLSGDDATMLGYLAQGGHGCISVVSNIAPAQCVEMMAKAKNNDFKAARKINDELSELNKKLFVETSPAPVKYALSRLAKCRNNIRLPLVKASKHCQDIIDKAMKKAKLIG